MAEVKSKDNTIVVDININDESAAETSQPKKNKDAIAATQLLNDGSSLLSSLPTGKYTRPFTQTIGLGNSMAEQAKTIAKGGAAGGITIASIVVAVLSALHTTVSDYVKDIRQSDELKRRAGFERKQ
ncbi:MAG: hypothetical protein AB7V00_06680 [Bacilli bacterium]